MPRPETPTLLRQLVSLGIIDREQHQVLADAYKARGAVAHGFKAQTDLTAIVHALLDFSNGLRIPQVA